MKNRALKVSAAAAVGPSGRSWQEHASRCRSLRCPCSSALLHWSCPCSLRFSVARPHFAHAPPSPHSRPPPHAPCLLCADGPWCGGRGGRRRPHPLCRRPAAVLEGQGLSPGRMDGRAGGRYPRRATDVDGRDPRQPAASQKTCTTKDTLCTVNLPRPVDNSYADAERLETQACAVSVA